MPVGRTTRSCCKSNVRRKKVARHILIHIHNTIYSTKTWGSVTTTRILCQPVSSISGVAQWTAPSTSPST